MSLILDRLIDVYRLQTDSGDSNKEQYQVYTPLADIAINIQPAQAEDVVIAGGAFGQAYTAFTTQSGILEGDKLIDQVLGDVFFVKGKSNWMTPSLSPHIELLLTEFATEE